VVDADGPGRLCGVAGLLPLSWPPAHHPAHPGL